MRILVELYQYQDVTQVDDKNKVCLGRISQRQAVPYVMGHEDHGQHLSAEKNSDQITILTLDNRLP